MSVARKRGFTLIEALAATVIMAVGIGSTVAGLGALSRSETRSREAEAMQRLALDKYDELVGTGQAATSQSGDFSDRDETRYTWSLDVAPSGIENLNDVTLSVTRADAGNNGPKQSVDGLIYVPPVTSGTTP